LLFALVAVKKKTYDVLAEMCQSVREGVAMNDPSSFDSLAGILRRAGLSREAVAASAEVSTQTVNNWCNGRTRLSPAQIQRVANVLLDHGVTTAQSRAFVIGELRRQGLDVDAVLAMAARGDRPSQAHKPVHVLSWSSQAVGIVEAAEACRGALERLGFVAPVIDCASSHSRKRDYVRAAIDAQAAGVVLMMPGEAPTAEADTNALVGDLSNAGIATVLWQYWNRDAGLPDLAATVRFDREAALMLAMEVLQGHGHQQIGGIFFGMSSYDNGLVRRFIDLPQSRTGDEHVKHLAVYEGTEESLEDLRRVLMHNTAAVVDSARATVACIRVVNELGIRIPEDFSLIIVGTGTAIESRVARRLTLVNPPSIDMGREVGMLMRRLVDRQPLRPEERYRTYGRESLSVVHAENGSVGPPPKQSVMPRSRETRQPEAVTPRTRQQAK